VAKVPPFDTDGKVNPSKKRKAIMVEAPVAGAKKKEDDSTVVAEEDVEKDDSAVPAEGEVAASSELIKPTESVEVPMAADSAPMAMTASFPRFMARASVVATAM